MSILIFLYRISVKCRPTRNFCRDFSVFVTGRKKLAFESSIICIPSKVDRFLDFIAVQNKYVPSYNKYRFVATLASSNEHETANEALKQVLLAVEDDPVSGKENCSIYIEKLCRSGNLVGVAQLLKGLRDKQIFLGSNTYRIVLDAAAQANDFELSSWAFKDLLLTSKSQDSTSFINVARAFQKATNSDPLLHFIRVVSELTFQRNATILNRIIDGCAETGQEENALLIFEHMKSLKCRPDTVTFNTVLSILGKLGRVDQMLLEFTSMKETGHVPDIITYTLVNCLRKVGRLDLCVIFIKEMVERGIEPDLRTYTALIDGFGRLGNVEKMLELFNEMKKRRVRPSIYAYRALISNLKKAGKFKLALSFSEEMNSWESKLVSPKDFRKKSR
ncbi:tetratricopeptide repeat (TPR)-like superfamily protein [Tasmannia lanceolata]|uniref:tetratricopeptide repeat (TPR)-like superfamily protein n=1 Tax=Tasmannia lanceolata TaxID=3420 RepID=UPI0040636199